MNKKIKSLIVAGVLVVSQSVTTFAMETNQFEGNDSNHETHQHEVGNGLVEQKMEANYIGLEYLKDENGNNIIGVYISEDGKIADVKVVADENGNYPVELKFIHVKGADGFNCYTLDEDAVESNNLTSPLKDDKIPEISHITVVYNVKNDTPVIPPEEPPTEGEVTVPETGEASILPYATMGTVSAIGLLFANKKKRK